MADYTVKITTQAKLQVSEIVDYIRFSLNAPIAAIRFVEEIEKKCGFTFSYAKKSCAYRRRAVAKLRHT